MGLILAATPFLIFLANVLAGSVGSGPFMGDVLEMLTLCLSCMGFVATIMLAEKRKGEKDGVPEKV